MTPHFTIGEFACRDGTPYPPAWALSRLRPLCEQLEILRAALGDRPMTITSGYRTPAYNRQIGGARASQHVGGRAADIRVAGVSTAKVHAVALALYRKGTLRIGGLGRYRTFTHVDTRPGDRLARWTGARVVG